MNLFCMLYIVSYSFHSFQRYVLKSSNKIYTFLPSSKILLQKLSCRKRRYILREYETRPKIAETSNPKTKFQSTNSKSGQSKNQSSDLSMKLQVNLERKQHLYGGNSNMLIKSARTECFLQHSYLLRQEQHFPSLSLI